MGIERSNTIQPQENQENLKKPEEIQVPQYILPVETSEDISAKEERERADAVRLEEIRASLGMPPSEEKATEPVEPAVEIPSEIQIEEKTEEIVPNLEPAEEPKPEEIVSEPKIEDQTEKPEAEEKKDVSQEKGIEIDWSLKRKGLDFTESLSRVNGRLSRMDREAEVVSPGTISKFRTATRNLENTFQGSKLDLGEVATSFNRLTTSFDDLSLINDRELRKITEDTRKSLIGAIGGSKDSAMALRAQEKMKELRKNIDRMIDKADTAAFRLRRGAR